MCRFWSASLVCSKKIKRSIVLRFTLLMCLKDLEESEKGKEKSSDMEKSIDCPLCLEPLEFDDKNFYPCACGYQVCRFCWHRIRTNENGLCPACRRIYSENPANFQPLTAEELQKVKLQKKMKDLQKKQKIAENRKQLGNIRVIQKNLVFAVGLPLELSQDNEKKEKVLQMFRQFGPTYKEAITDRTSYAGSQGPSACVYITFQKSEDAVRAVKSLTNTKMEGRTIKVSLGTTKYCSNFLKNVHCPKAECLYLHELADEEASFTKEDIHLGKHLEYEQKLLEQTLNSTSHNKVVSSNEVSRTNHNRNADAVSDCSDESPQNNSFYDSSETSELSPSSNSQTLESARSVGSDLNIEAESNHQIHSSNSDSRSNPPDTSSNSMYRTEETVILNNHLSNSSFKDSLNSSNLGYHNQMQQKESEHLQQSNHLYENVLQNSTQEKESTLLKLISSMSSDNSPTKQTSNMLNVKQEHIDSQPQTHDEDDADLEFDPCQLSLNGLQDLLISEAKERARIFYNSMNRSPFSNRSPPIPQQMQPPDIGFRNTMKNLEMCQVPKIRDPPPGFTNNYQQNIVYKSAYDAGSPLLNKGPVALHNQLSTRTNYTLQRFPQPGVSLNNSGIPLSSTGASLNSTAVSLNSAGASLNSQGISLNNIGMPLNNTGVSLNTTGISLNNAGTSMNNVGISLNNTSYLPDYSTPLSREVPDIISPLLQHQNQRIVNMPQVQQFPVTEQRSSPMWNNTAQSTHWRPVENAFYTQNVQENRTANDLNMRMQQLRSTEATMRQWQLPGNVTNSSSFQDPHQLITSLLPDQMAKAQQIFPKTYEIPQRNSSSGHRLQYTKKL